MTEVPFTGLDADGVCQAHSGIHGAFMYVDIGRLLERITSVSAEFNAAERGSMAREVLGDRWSYLYDVLKRIRTQVADDRHRMLERYQSHLPLRQAFDDLLEMIDDELGDGLPSAGSR